MGFLVSWVSPKYKFEACAAKKVIVVYDHYLFATSGRVESKIRLREPDEGMIEQNKLRSAIWRNVKH
jgi:hypothetical protein